MLLKDQPINIKNFKLYRKAERFDEVLHFNTQQLDEYLNLIATKRRKLEGILYGFSSGGYKTNEKEKTQSEHVKVLEAMHLILERTQ